MGKFLGLMAAMMASLLITLVVVPALGICHRSFTGMAVSYEGPCIIEIKYDLKFIIRSYSERKRDVIRKLDTEWMERGTDG